MVSLKVFIIAQQSLLMFWSSDLGQSRVCVSSAAFMEWWFCVGLLHEAACLHLVFVKVEDTFRFKNFNLLYLYEYKPPPIPTSVKFLLNIWHSRLLWFTNHIWKTPTPTVITILCPLWSSKTSCEQLWQCCFTPAGGSHEGCSEERLIYIFTDPPNTSEAKV